MKPIRSHTFRGRKFKIDIGAFDGLCESPYDTDPTPVIRIPADLNTQGGLETCIHEGLHACQWAKGEEIVDESARDIARFLRRLGYSRKE